MGKYVVTITLDGKPENSPEIEANDAAHAALIAGADVGVLILLQSNPVLEMMGYETAERLLQKIESLDVEVVVTEVI